MERAEHALDSRRHGKLIAASGRGRKILGFSLWGKRGVGSSFQSSSLCEICTLTNGLVDKEMKTNLLFSSMNVLLPRQKDSYVLSDFSFRTLLVDKG